MAHTDTPAQDAPAEAVEAVEAVEETPKETKKLSKKQKKALEFRSKKKSGETAADETKADKADKKASKKRKAEESEEAVPADGSEAPQPKPKKQKKPQVKDSAGNVKAKAAPRFILFCGNLPYNYTVDKLEKHFEAAAPITIRQRENAGFAFLEFPTANGEDGKPPPNGDASRRLKVALRLHHSMFMNRRINVEMTAGGGGNSSKRRGRIEEKRDKVATENHERMREEQAAREKREKAQRRHEAKERKNEFDNRTHLQGGVHPSRLKKLL